MAGSLVRRVVAEPARVGAREASRIDGQSTREVDVRCCHPRLLCALASLELPFLDPAFDFYEIKGTERALVKLTVNVLLECANSSECTPGVGQGTARSQMNMPRMLGRMH